MKILIALLISIGSTLIAGPHSLAHAADSVSKPLAKKENVKKAIPAKKEVSEVHEEDQEPDVSLSTVMDYHCELGNKITIYRNHEDDNNLALRWKKQLLRLKRVETTTGANRFENKKNGWVWIDIPTKGMLLDAKKGQQLANECRNPQKM